MRHSWRLESLWGLALAFLVFVFFGSAHGAEPTQRWFTLTTPHFYVHYYQSLRHDERSAAERVARVAERCHAVLVPIFKHAPASRTHIVVTDTTDGANGSAQAAPYNIIRVFLTAPGSRSSLQDHDDWLMALIMHEYTHILHLDTIHGLPRVINAVMGRIWVPNQLQPRWFIEGLAVHQETRRTSGGRNRSAIFDMIMRSHVLEGKLLRLDQISSSTRIYPRGDVPYLYGAQFVRFIAERYGDTALTRISHGYGGTPVPYALNRVVKRVVGKTYEQLYGEFAAHLRQRFEIQRQAVLSRGLTRHQELTRHGWSVGSPRLSLDGRRFVYLASDGVSPAEIRIVKTSDFLQHGAHGLPPEQVMRWPHLGGSTVAFTPDGLHLVYGQGVNWRTYHSYHDIFVRRLADGRVRQLTDGLRARDPDVSTDGRSVVFVTNELGVNSLALMPFEGGKVRWLVKGRRHEQFFRPRFSPDGRSIVVSHWRKGGKRDIALIALSDGRSRLLTDDRAIDMDPTFSRDGRHIYFSSDRSGIFNIYRFEVATGRLKQMTNVLGGAFAPAVAAKPSRLIYVGFSSRGYDLHAIDLPRGKALEPLPHVHERPAPAAIPATNKASGTPLVARPYNPLRTVYPRAWTATLGADSFGTVLGLEVLGSDVIDRHRYALVGSLSTGSGHFSYAAHYAYSRFWPSFSLDTSRFVGARGGLVLDGERFNYLEENYGAGLTIGLPVLRIPRHSVHVAAGYRFNWFRDAEERFQHVLPGQASPRLPEVGLLSGVTLSISYSSVQRFSESVSKASGRQLSLSLRVDSEHLGSEFSSTQISWSWAEFFSMPFFENHVLALRYGGGVARGDFKRRGFFFIGGFPEQNLIQALIDQASMGGSHLRGFAPGSFFGDQFHLLNVEYRMPLLELERGMSSLPLYFNYVHLSVFSDIGNAFFDEFAFGDLRVGFGGELLLEFVIGYFVPLTLRVGYARGLGERGGNEFFTVIGRRF